MNGLRKGDLVGLHSSGYGSEGIEAALRKWGAAGKVVWVSHEMLDRHRQYIEEGTMDVAIDQDPDGQVISALQHILHACGVLEGAPPRGPVEFRIFCSANVRRTVYLGAALSPRAEPLRRPVERSALYCLLRVRAANLRPG